MDACRCLRLLIIRSGCKPGTISKKELGAAGLKVS